MAFDNEDDLRAFKAAVFNSGTNPGRASMDFFAQAMRWPVDSLAPETRAGDGSTEHHVSWIKGDAIGHAVATAGAEPAVSAVVHPLHAVTGAEIGATVRRHAFDHSQLSIVRSLTVRFADDDSLTIDLDSFSVEHQRSNADAFIDVVLDAIARRGS